MNIKKVTAIWFSATGTTRLVAQTISDSLAKHFQVPKEEYDFTLPEKRKGAPQVKKEELVVFGMPVYAGRVPNLLKEYIASFKGNGAFVVPVVLYGNRSMDDGLMELNNILTSGGFISVAAAAFVGQHAFVGKLAQGRPDEGDLQIANQFADAVYRKIKAADTLAEITTPHIPGNNPVGSYYRPRGLDGNPVNFLKAKPVTLAICNQCKKCVAVCPMGAIDENDPTLVHGICIKCGACLKYCPVQAKIFEEEAFISHKKALERDYADVRREVNVFL